MGTVRHSLVASSVLADPADVASVTNAPAVVTYTAIVGQSHYISGVCWSYSAAPTAGRLTIEDGTGNIVFDINITGAGAGFFPFDPPKGGTPNTTMIVTLAAGGAGVVGKVTVPAHWSE